MTTPSRRLLSSYTETTPSGLTIEVEIVETDDPALLAGMDLLVERALRETAGEGRQQHRKSPAAA